MSKVMNLDEFMETMNEDIYRYLHLQPGEVKCDHCSGTGDDLSPNYGDKYHSGICKKCNGYGKVNWIQNIFGRQ